DKTLADLYSQLEKTNAKLDGIRSNTGATAAGIANAIGKTLQSLMGTTQTPQWDESNLNMTEIQTTFTNAMKKGISNLGAEGMDVGAGFLGTGSGIELSRTISGGYQAAFIGQGGKDIGDFIFKNADEITKSMIWNFMQKTPEYLHELQHDPRYSGYASGSMSTPEGLAWAGDRGPELINFPAGSRVYNTNDSMNMLTNAVRSAIGSSSGGEKHFHVHVGSKEIAHIVYDSLRTDPEVKRQVRKIAING
ncbi:MAG: hypothetical protein MIO92_15215, partial [Methanosarcinaceae archaeon]|nr:hypothetical protein [Methanosarcinaceae archaeon]